VNEVQSHTESRSNGSLSRLQRSFVLAVVSVATIPFLAKPLHIDDPADLQYVRQILREPLDPYGFEVDWDEGPRPAFRNYHPPLKYYYHALVLALFPTSEIVLHISYIPFVALTAWAVVRLARRFDCSPVPLLVVWMLGPGYLPGQNAMLDVPVIALGLAATALWIDAVDAGRTGRVVLAGLLLAAALLTKYSAFIYVPVWIVYLIARGRWRDWLGLVVPAAVFALWCGWSAWRYGEAHPRILFAGNPGLAGSHGLAERLLPAVVFLGGSMPAAVVFCWRLGRPGKTVTLISGVLALAAAWAATPHRLVANGSPLLTPINFALWGVLATTGISVILCSVWSGRITTSSHDRGECRAGPVRIGDVTILAAWFCLALVIGVGASPFLAMRRVVEASLAAWMLLIRRDESGRRVIGIPVGLAVAVNSLVGFLVAAADFEFATVYPRFAGELAEITRANPSRVWCHGYWGWSYYTRSAGLQHYVLDRDRPLAGTVLVIPDDVAKPATLPDAVRFAARKKHEELTSGHIPIRIMNHRAGAGYYGSAWGPLPYALSTTPLEFFDFYELDPGAP
jgi:hypothetical protein